MVCGGRDFFDREAIYAELDNFHRSRPVSILIHGGANGADRIANASAKENRLPVETYIADFHNDGRWAGTIRNERLLHDAKPDVVIAFPGEAGTSHMLRIAREVGVDILKQIPWQEVPPRSKRNKSSGN